MLFSEIYGSYYNAVARAIAEAQEGMLDADSLFGIVRELAFPESVLTVVPALEKGSWPLVKDDWTTNIRRPPTMPLSLLQKRWLKSLCADPRIRLFVDDAALAALRESLRDVEPLFSGEDYFLYDAFCDHDDFEDEKYRENFRTAMRAIHGGKRLRMTYARRDGRTNEFTCLPCKMEYSLKDGKFRLVSLHRSHRIYSNMARMVSCRIVEGPDGADNAGKVGGNVRDVPPLGSADGIADGAGGSRISPPSAAMESVILEIYDERKALERVLHAFAHFEKSCEKLGDDSYRLTLSYDARDRTELVVRVLGFGPMVKVLEPASFVAEMRERIAAQMALM